MAKDEVQEFQKKLDSLSKHELRELVMVNTYKLALTRNQLDAVVDILIKKKLTTYEEIWKRTNERFQESQEK
jgi:hypothetical protein